MCNWLQMPPVSMADYKSDPTNSTKTVSVSFLDVVCCNDFVLSLRSL